jgi:hypothetical protein
LPPIEGRFAADRQSLLGSTALCAASGLLLLLAERVYLSLRNGNDPSGRGAVLGWSNGGDAFANPDAFEKVCVYRSRFVAWAVYEWQSLHRVGGEDWPNFEPDSDAPTVPRQVATLEALHADQWEIGCGLGDPDTLCGVWTFRARYNEVLVVMELRTIDAGLRFGAMRRLVQSVDHDLTAKMR